MGARERMCAVCVCCVCVLCVCECFSLRPPVLPEPNGQCLKFKTSRVSAAALMAAAAAAALMARPSARLSTRAALFIKALLLSQTHKSEWASGSKVMLKSSGVRLCRARVGLTPRSALAGLLEIGT